jgi:glycosyltransferase involved in cell wall biosynthesis
MSRSGSVAVAIPAYQAAASIGEVVRRTLPILGEVLVVDDGSTDATAARARASGARVVCHPVNRGKGRALHTAFEDLFARGAVAVVTLDADGQHLPEEIPVLLDAARQGGDLILGSRAHLFAEMRPLRRASNSLSSHLIAAVAGLDLGDVQSGFRLYTRRLLAATGFPEARFDAESAVVVRAARAGFGIREVPLRLGFANGLPTSHYRPLLDSLRIARSVARARLENREWVHTPSS